MQVLCVGGWRGGGRKGGTEPLKQPKALFVSLASPAAAALQPGEARGCGWKPPTPLFAATTQEAFLCKKAQSKQPGFLLMRAKDRAPVSTSLKAKAQRAGPAVCAWSITASRGQVMLPAQTLQKA